MVKLIAIVGETASGKSSLAMEIAKQYDGQLICADSRTVFKGMDVGTAKPSKSEQELVKHYGLDLVEPSERYTAAQFKAYADDAIADIAGHSKLPILVGGTGLYINGVLYGYSFGGDVDEAKRSALNNKTVDQLTTLAKEMNIDISESTRDNKRHILRLIERNGTTENNKQLVHDTLLLGLTLSKTQLRKRVEHRVEAMFRMGLRKEYNDLRALYKPDSEAFTGIGYREFADWEAGNASISEVKRMIVKNTMNLAKRQRTWFKRDKNITWVETQDEAMKCVRDFMKTEEASNE